MRHLKHVLSTLVVTLGALGTGSPQDIGMSATSTGPCSRTAEVALTACRNDALDSYWTTVGRCINTADRAERQACYADATTALQEERDLCPEQYAARLRVCHALGEARYDPPFDPADFVDPLQIGKSVHPNRYFPLVPGSKWVYRSATETTNVEVLGKVRKFLGVPCTAVHDVVSEGGKVIEDTIDWYAQKTDGTVWYCGEVAREFERGLLVDLQGSWQTGRDLARPGIIMLASPHVGDFYRQEFLLGEAEDVARVTSVAGSATTPAASCKGTCLVTRDFTPIEPDAIERKFYAPGIGLILEIDPATGERTQLVSYRIP